MTGRTVEVRAPSNYLQRKHGGELLQLNSEAPHENMQSPVQRFAASWRLSSGTDRPEY
jgi:hypothetical protein